MGTEQTSQIIIYQAKDGQTRLDVRLEDETVWLTQEQMADLYGKSKSTINEHIKNVYDEKELEKESTMRKFGISEFSTKPTNFYNLDVIISVGYRVKSVQEMKKGTGKASVAFECFIGEQKKKIGAQEIVKK